MSLNIDTSKVTSVLIAGEWYPVNDQSFTLDAYEFVAGDHPMFPSKDGITTPHGFAFKTDLANPSGGRVQKSERWVYGPMTSIQSLATEADSLDGPHR